MRTERSSEAMLSPHARTKNWKYIALGIVRRCMPEKFLFAWLNLRGGVNSAEISPAQKFLEWNAQLAQERIDLADKVVLEMGSGRYARLALQMLAAGARRVMLVDPYALPLNHPAQRAVLAQDCANVGLPLAALARIEIYSQDILTLVLPQIAQQPDLVVSTAVLEHVRDPEKILRRCYAWLKPNGVTFHIVDLRDHNLAFAYPFEMLTYRQAVWDKWLDLRGGFHLNRWRAPNYLRALVEAKFVNVRLRTFLQDRAALEKIWTRIQPEFQTLGKEHLVALGIYLYGEKA